MPTIAVEVRTDRLPNVVVYRDGDIIATGAYAGRMGFVNGSYTPDVTERELVIAKDLVRELGGAGRIAEVPALADDDQLGMFAERNKWNAQGLHIRCETCHAIYPQRGRLPEHCWGCGARLLFDDESDEDVHGRIVWWRPNA